MAKQSALNDTLSSVLRKFTDKYQTNWDVYLPHAIFAYNTSEHDRTGMTPYFLLYGIEPPLEAERQWDPAARRPPDHDFGNLEILPAVRRFAADVVQNKYDNEKERYDTGRRQPLFTAGMKVMVRIPQNVGADGLSARFRMPYIGPFEVVCMPTENTVRISGTTGRMKTLINISRVKPFRPRRPLECDDESSTTEQVTENEMDGVEQLFSGQDQSLSQHDTPPATADVGSDTTATEPTAAQNHHQSTAVDDVATENNSGVGAEERISNDTPGAATRRTRSGRVSRPPARLIEVCPIIESVAEEEGSVNDDISWCMTVMQSLSLDSSLTSKATNKTGGEKEVKFEKIISDGYHSAAYTMNDGDDMFESLVQHVGDETATLVRDATLSRQIVSETRDTAEGRLYIARGRVRRDGRPATQACDDKTAATMEAGSDFISDSDGRVRTSQGWRTSLKSLEWD